jgi:hypothetical protein
VPLINDMVTKDSTIVHNRVVTHAGDLNVLYHHLTVNNTAAVVAPISTSTLPAI